MVCLTIMISNLNSILAGFAGKRVLVIGDVMLDEYIWGNVNRISPEAPVMVVEAAHESKVPGGAANVVNNLCALDATGIVMGVVGNDNAGRTLEAVLRERGANTSGLVTANDRQTTRKVRVLAHSQQIVRVDHETRSALSPDSIQQMLVLLSELLPGADAVILSDYQKGVLSERMVQECVAAARLFGKPITGNLKPASLSADCKLTLITLNLSEAKQATGMLSLESDDDVARAGQKILESTGADNVLITRGADGLSLFSQRDESNPHHIAAHPVAVYDVAGAGDTVISTLTLALAAGASPIEAVTLANYAGAEVVKKLGVATVSRLEVESALSAWNITPAVDTLPGSPVSPS